MNNPSILSHVSAIFGSLFALIRSPESIPGNLLETFSEWNRSRRWRMIWITLAALLVNIGLWSVAGFFAFRSTSSVVQASMTQVGKRFAQDDLSTLAFEEHYIRNSIKQRSKVDDVVNNSGNDRNVIVRPKLVAGEELVNSEKFREAEVLLLRAYRASPDSVQAKFQLALLRSLDTNLPDPEKAADELMEKLAANEADPFPPAHAWLAVSMMGRTEQLKPTDMIQLEKYLKVASQWKSIEPGLLSIYSTICLQTGKPEKALAIAKLAAETLPELNLPYAQLCRMIGPQHDAEFNRASKAAEKAYAAKLDKPTATDSDRLGLAKVLMLQSQRDKAVEILQQGITDDPKAHQLVRRGLADLYIDQFRSENESRLKEAIAADTGTAIEPGIDPNAAQKSEEEEIIWTSLQEAAKIDRDNPTVGQEIAFQWRKLATPPADLVEVLRYQLVNNVATNGARLMIAELYLIKGRLPEAKQQWEIILEKDPHVIPALNNLSVILSRDNPPQLTRAIELIDRAYRMQPLNAEMCDTYGEVFMNAGRPMDAIAKLEESIRLDANRIATRKKLAACYRELGMNDMANEQLAQVARLEEDREKSQKDNPPIK